MSKIQLCIQFRYIPFMGEAAKNSADARNPNLY